VISIDYSRVAGGFGPPGATTRCRVVPAVANGSAYNRCERDCRVGEKRRLYMELETAQMEDAYFVKGPADLFRCDFDGDPATLSKLRLEVNEVVGVDWEQLDPDVALLTECGDASTTTTTSSTTTSTTNCEGPDCDNREVSVAVWLDNPVLVGAIQFDARFACDLGRFKPIAADSGRVQCKLEVPGGAVFATHQSTKDDIANSECRRRLGFGLGSTSGILGPKLLATCSFEVASGSVDPTAEDFEVTMVDAVTPDFEDLMSVATVSLRGFDPIQR
ncbi:MAG: hypothetical protein HY899_03265, partial [Deltaproteobacteria bacterium]|nr:hypothetical protein [Deltaproteobacteria bacterium]